MKSRIFRYIWDTKNLIEDTKKYVQNEFVWIQNH